MSIRDTQTAGGLQICMGLPSGGGCPNSPGFCGLGTRDVSALPSEQGCCSHLRCRRAIGLSWKVPSCHVKKKAATCRLHEYVFFPLFSPVIFCCCFCFIGLTRCSKHLATACLFFRLFCVVLVTQQQRKEQECLCHIFCRATQMFQHLCCRSAGAQWHPVAGSTPSPGFPAMAPVKLGNLQYSPVPGSLVLRCGTAGGEPSTGLGLRFGFGRALLRDLGKTPLFKCQVISHT